MTFYFNSFPSLLRHRITLLALTFFLLIGPLVFAHVGSSGVIVQKKAGPYQLLVSIMPPDVIPGTATVTVFIEQGRASSIQARPIYFDSGDEGAPTHDVLTAQGGNRYEGIVWLMDSGSSSVQLAIDGPDGKAEVVVPIMSIATAQRDMPAGTGFVLAVLGLLLVIMMITIIGASNADGIVPPGQQLPKSFRRRRLVGMSIGAVALALILSGWRSWWVSSAEEYRNEQLYQPMPIHTSVTAAGSQNQLTIQLDTTGFAHNWQKRRAISYVLPDHGKLMHAFLIRTPGLDAFAHLHPNRRDTLHYDATLPALPGGNYLVYADVVYRSGYAETLTDTITIPASNVTSLAANNPSDPDDSWLVAEPMGVKANTVNVPHLDNDMVVCGKPSASVKLADGSTMLWTDKPGKTLESGKLYTLKFAVADVQGKAAPIEPYLGMSGHAAILRSDGTVYIHLHPVGTYSMAAEGSLTSRISDTSRTFHYPNASKFRDSIDTYVTRLKTLPEAEKNRLLMASMPEMDHKMAINNMVQFPYAFPKAGYYRIWVQVKRNGQVLTGVFDTQVDDPLM